MEMNNKELEEMLRSALGKKDSVEEVLLGSAEKIDQLTKKDIKARLPRERINALVEENPEFAEATRKGFSETEIKQILVHVGDYFIEKLELKRFESSAILALVAAKMGTKLDFSKLTGETISQWVLSKDKEKASRLLSPEFKRECIYTDAVNLVTEKKNISFNTAIRRAIANCNSADYIAKQLKEMKENYDPYCDAVKPVLDWFLEHEMEILIAIMTK